MSATPSEDVRLGGGDGCKLHEVTNCDMCSTKEPVTIESLQALLRQARQWVLGCYPSCQEEAEDRERMIQRIDAAAPPPPEWVFEDCDKDSKCCLGKGHYGECSDIPF